MASHAAKNDNIGGKNDRHSYGWKLYTSYNRWPQSQVCSISKTQSPEVDVQKLEHVHEFKNGWLNSVDEQTTVVSMFLFLGYGKCTYGPMHI